MSADVYAILILAPLFITGILLSWFGGRPPKGQGAIRTCVAVAAIVCSALYPVSTGAPVLPSASLLVFPCLVLCLSFVKRLPIALAVGFLFFLQGFFGQWLYEAALHEKGSTDASPRYIARAMDRNFNGLVTAVFLSAKHPEADYPPGYLDEFRDADVRSVASELSNPTYRGGFRGPVMDYRVEPYWHTRFTGLWHMQTRPARIWFDGGQLNNEDAYHLQGVGQFEDGYVVRPMRA